MKNFFRGSGIFVLLLAVILLMTFFFGGGAQKKPEELSYTEFLQKVSEEKVQAVAIVDIQLVGIYKDTTVKDFPDKGYDFTTYIPSSEELYQDLAKITNVSGDKTADELTALDYGFDILHQPIPEQPWWLTFIPYLIMFVLLGGFMAFIIHQSQGGGGGNKVMSFGKSRARMQTDDQKKVTFANVEGADEEKEELREIVDFLKDPRRFTDLGARIPKGVLLVGPPGTGKTLLAKAVAGEAGVPFFSISGSDFVEMFVGVGASRVRDLFDQAKKHAPCIVFIDEIDAVGRHRGAGLGGGHDEREQTLNQLLVEMDGFAVNEGIIILAATNRPDILDPALLRPGRFDRQIVVNEPDVKGRAKIIALHAKGKPISQEVDFKVLAKRTPGFTGADIENMLNEAAILAARRRLKQIGMREIEEAITRVIAGPEKRSRVVTEQDKRMVAYHEAGHAIVAYALPHCDPVHEVSIIPRGRASGYTLTLPKEDTQHISKGKLLDQIAELLAGRVAESLVLHDVTTGAYNDLQRASKIVRAMVTEYGMSDVVGPVFLGDNDEIFIGRDFGHTRPYSEELAAQIDDEMKRILEEGFDRARTVLTENMDKLHKVVEALLEHEKIDGEQFAAIMRGESLPPETPAEPAAPAAEPAQPEEPSQQPGGQPPQAP